MTLNANISTLATTIGTEFKADRARLGSIESAATALTGRVTAVENAQAGASGIDDSTTGPATAWSSQKTSTQITAAISGLVAGAPAALDTLKEIADSLSAGDTAAAALTAQVTQLKADLGDLTTDYAAVFQAAL